MTLGEPQIRSLKKPEGSVSAIVRTVPQNYLQYLIRILPSLYNETSLLIVELRGKKMKKHTMGAQKSSKLDAKQPGLEYHRTYPNIWATLPQIRTLLFGIYLVRVYLCQYFQLANMNPTLARRIQAIIPKLSSARRKGDNGRIAVVGGSFEFTGAPFYSAISSLKIGADLAHIFCAKTAANAIKAYTPEVIAHPIFTLSDEIGRKVDEKELQAMEDEWIDKILAWEGAITSWVIGPGLGRDKHLDGFFPKFIRKFKKRTLLTFDADGIYYLCRHPDLFDVLKNHQAILTPNHKELNLIQKAKDIKISPELLVKDVHAEKIQVHENVIYNHPFSLFVKGSNDFYFNDTECMEIMAEGGYKRCGGIGDILAGAIGTCVGWDFHYGPALAAWVIKKATRMAYEKQGRSQTAPSVLTYIHTAFQQVEQELARASKN